MKRIFGLLAVLFVSLAVILPLAAAEPLYAEALYRLDLVQGYATESGAPNFGLADKLTRAQAVVLLERYLGVLDTAVAENGDAPFDDVPAWAAPYVAYATANKLVSGKVAPSGKAYFDADAAVSAPEFLTLILRAMEYTDKTDGSGDFVWSDPYALSDKLGITNGAVTDFLRGDAFKVCWLALGTVKKSGKKVADGLMEKQLFDETALAQATRMAAGEPIVVACVGDSLTQGTGSSNAAKYSYPARLGQLLGKGYTVVNCGKAASYVMDPTFAFNAKSASPELWYPNTAAYMTLLRSKPDVIIVMLGTNDARSMTDPSSRKQFIKDYKNLIADFAALESKPQICLAYAYPAVNAAITYEGTALVMPDLIKQAGDELGLPVLPLGDELRDYYTAVLPYNDRVHPTDVTYPAMAQYFYNHIFGGKVSMDTVDRVSQADVVYVSDYGTMYADGSSDKTPVSGLAYAVATLADKGGTVVVCGPVTVPFTVLPHRDGNVTITSVYGGVDYAKTAGAKMIFKSSLFSECALTFEKITLHAMADGQGIYMQYHDLTVGADVTCTAESNVTTPLSLNAGFTEQLAATATEVFDCKTDCTVTVNGGRWSILRCGNKRAKPAYAVGALQKGAKLTVIINGGEFVSTGSLNSSTGQNDMRGELYVEINGGSFASPFYVFSRIGTNNTGDVVYGDGSATVKVTGGDFKGGFYAVYPNGGITPKNKISLFLSENMRGLSSDREFDISYIKD